MTSAASFFHVGILVDDLDKAIKRFENVLEIEFLAPVNVHVDYLEQAGETTPLDLHISYSKQGPPYYELLEAQGAGIYGIHQGIGVHHIGVWEPNCENRLERLVHKHGLVREAVQYTPDRRIIVAYLEPTALYGTRIEIVDQGRKDQMDAWLAGGPWID